MKVEWSYEKDDTVEEFLFHEHGEELSLMDVITAANQAGWDFSTIKMTGSDYGFFAWRERRATADEIADRDAKSKTEEIRRRIKDRLEREGALPVAPHVGFQNIGHSGPTHTLMIGPDGEKTILTTPARPAGVRNYAWPDNKWHDQVERLIDAEIAKGATE